ncbi:glycosyltransferase family 2 protein [Serratia sp. 3ACOL1]|uniref:glycosyltransferase family 2 protein n=1 Tax=Serratia sp. 3ACOL1 TaxID=2448483 RepID=UPI000EF4C0A7|nr:glycosyltransferase family 2 protein [Serratia sp. 3ACOL1]AYM89672.1 glycosyltransferase family 2 protein [Serratia sp. 3ACOL1]
MKVSIIIPTYNGGSLWEKSAKAIRESYSQSSEVLVIDSSSNDSTVEVARKYNFFIEVIPSSEFNHGGTRNKAVKNSTGDIVVFITQDAIPKKESIDRILAPFSDPDVACAYGRQLPHNDANPLAKHARKFNYGENSYVSDITDSDRLGLKTVFMSNSFSAYRVSIFNELGAFPENTILCEDMYLAAKAILANFKIAYVADAEVYHSHNYTVIEEFKRYFDIGVFHQDEPWIRKSFGGASGEGKKFIFSELRYLLKNGILWLPIACVNNIAKLAGYKLGQRYKRIPAIFRRKLSMHKRYWDNF